MIKRAAPAGYELKTGVECEYFLTQPDGKTISDGADTQSKPCYDQQALMRRYDVIAEICDSMIALGWQPYQNDHEDANGQFEMNWESDSALKPQTATPFSNIGKSIAEKHGFARHSSPSRFRILPAMAVTRICRCRRKLAKMFADPIGELGLSTLPITSSPA